MLLPAPPALVDAQGQVPFGLFDATVPRINGRDFDYRTPMDAPQGALARRFHYKQFQYFGVLGEDVLAGCALAHTGWLGLAFVYAWDTRARRLHAETFRVPLGLGLTMSTSPTGGESRLAGRGADIRLGYAQDAAGVLTKTVAVSTRQGLRLNATMTEAAPFRPLSICTQTGINGWTYANKVAGLPVQGTITLPDGNRHDLAGACGHHDFSAGYMRRETFWNWACLSGRAGGRVLGLNISCGVNETSHSENCLWVDGELIPTGLARFRFDRRQPDAPWQVTTADGAVDLSFTPAGLHSERMDLKLFATNFRQFFGRYSGTIRARGEEIVVDGLWGFVEDQYAKW